jgi:hypothetical protein
MIATATEIKSRSVEWQTQRVASLIKLARQEIKFICQNATLQDPGSVYFIIFNGDMAYYSDQH